MRELETSLQQFGEFLFRARLVTEKAAPYCARWVRRFLMRPASDEPLADQTRRFCEALERDDRCQDWQVRQAEQALRLYFVNFHQRTDWHRLPASAAVDEHGRTSPLPALEQLRLRIRTRHYSYRTEGSYVDWVRRFFDYLADRDGVPNPHVDTAAVHDYLTHLAVRRRVSASTQNQPSARSSSCAARCSVWTWRISHTRPRPNGGSICQSCSACPKRSRCSERCVA